MDTNVLKVSVRFNLRDDVEKDTKNSQYTIRCTARYANKRVRFAIKETIEPRFWNEKLQRAKATNDNNDHARLNAKLNDIEVKVIDLINRFIKDYNRRPEPKEVSDIFQKEYFEKIPQSTTIKKMNFFDVFDEYIEKTRLNCTHSTAKKYQSVKNILLDFSKRNKQQVQFEHFNMSFRNKYIDYLQTVRGYAPTTLYRHMKMIKTVLHYAINNNYIEKLNINLNEWNTKNKVPNKIALSEYELQEIENLDLSNTKRLDTVRDRFLLGCFTGARFSDFIRFDKNNINGDDFSYRQKKTKEPVTIPYMDEVKRIFEKYNYDLPKPISEQRFNQYLKEITIRCNSLQRLDEVTEYVKGKEVTKKVARHTLITSHTARRTFTTINYARGMDLETIAIATGHSSTKQLQQYIKMDDKQRADVFRNEYNRINKGIKDKKDAKVIQMNTAN